jgi:hypothetical protein
MDFDKFIEWADKGSYAVQDGDTLTAVRTYWENEVKPQIEYNSDNIHETSPTVDDLAEWDGIPRGENSGTHTESYNNDSYVDFETEADEDEHEI